MSSTIKVCWRLVNKIQEKRKKACWLDCLKLFPIYFQVYKTFLENTLSLIPRKSECWENSAFFIREYGDPNLFVWGATDIYKCKYVMSYSKACNAHFIKCM